MQRKKSKPKPKRPRRRNRVNKSTSSPQWTDLPRDITANILQRLGTVEILCTAQKVCITWEMVCRNYPHMWRVIDMKHYCGIHDDAIWMCRRAVEFSQGQATHINIGYFGTDELLRYISERCSQLKCLRIGSDSKISNKCLRKSVAKLPQLEELRIPDNFYYPRIDIDAIRRLCPTLNSLKCGAKVWNRML